MMIILIIYIYNREEQKLFNLRPEIIDLILFNVTNSFDWRTAVDINKIIWEFFNIFSRLETVEQLCNKLFYYGECHKKMIEV